MAASVLRQGVAAFSALTWFQNFVQSGCAYECPFHILGHSGQRGIVACGFFVWVCTENLCAGVGSVLLAWRLQAKLRWAECTLWCNCLVVHSAIVVL